LNAIKTVKQLCNNVALASSWERLC